MSDALPLRDLHLPADVSAWPPAFGWWLLVIGLLAGLYFAVRYFRGYRVRRAALTQLAEIQTRFARDGDERRLVSDVSTLLRRVCISYGPRRELASLTGERWVAALAEVTRSRGHFSTDVARQVSSAPYDPRAGVDSTALLTEARRWMRALPPLARAA